MNIIVSVDKNWAIGYKDELLFRISEDLRRFKELTIGKVVIMGDTTLKTMPKCLPLPGRENIILAEDEDFTVPGAQTVHSLPQLFSLLKDYDSENVFIIGGASVYEQMLPHCSLAYITKVEAAAEADRFFPNLDILPNWQLKEKSSGGQHEGIDYYYCLYENADMNP